MTGEVTRVLPKEPPQYFDHAVWARIPGQDAPALAFTSDRGGDNHRLWLLREGGERPEALSPQAPWDVEWVAAGGDRRTLVYSVNEQGVSVLHALRLREGGGGIGRRREAVAAPRNPQGHHRRRRSSIPPEGSSASP